MPETKELVEYGGLLLVCLIVYCQVGLFFCFFIPGSAFVFFTGVMIAAGELHNSIIGAYILLSLAAVSGSATGYMFGKRAGRMIYNRPDSRWFKQKYLVNASHFFEKHGNWALSLGMFFPVINTFIPIVSGAIGMRFRRFFFYQSLGAFFWIASILFAGYFIGGRPVLRPYAKYVTIGALSIATIVIIYKLTRDNAKK